LTQTPSLARRLLSETAAQLTDADVAAMEAATAGYPVHLTDVQPGLDVHSFFSRWGDSVAAVQKTGADSGATTVCVRVMSTLLCSCLAFILVIYR